MRNMNLNTLTFTTTRFKSHTIIETCLGKRPIDERVEEKRENNKSHLSFNLLYL